ncbi:MAG: hypothetical protein COA58_12345 [Bacteroidetes bacterium]|nr:MAG: hypothetical protein COA58_12345 [Bacteroidota bacterium]
MKRLLIIIILQTIYCQPALCQEKNILDKSNIIYIDTEFPDAFFARYNILKPSVKLNLGFEKRVNKNRSLTGRIMYNKFVTSPWSKSRLRNIDYYSPDTTLPAERIGYSIQTGVDLAYKFYRKKKNSIFPFGSYFEFGLGYHNTKFTGTKRYYSVYNSARSRDELILVDEPPTGVKTISLAFSGGRQWLLNDNLLVGFGFRYRLHIPVKFDNADLSQFPQRVQDEIKKPSYYYRQDVLFTDWYSTFIKVGCLF